MKGPSLRNMALRGETKFRRGKLKRQKMTKRIEKQLNKFRYQNQPLRLNLGVLILTGLCSFLIVIATFTQFDFHHFILPFDSFSSSSVILCISGCNCSATLLSSFRGRGRYRNRDRIELNDRFRYRFRYRRRG